MDNTSSFNAWDVISSYLPPHPYNFNANNNAIDSTVKQNHLAINAFGDLCFLSIGKKSDTIKRLSIYYTNIRKLSNGIVKISKLPINIDEKDFQAYGFNSISFNEGGTSLLLWSPSCVGFISIPKEMLHDHCLKHFDSSSVYKCELKLLAKDMISSCKDVVKATFHNQSQSHVVVLRSEGTLLLVDGLSGITQQFNLPLGKAYVSYTFGPIDVDWLRFTIFVCSNNGEIFALCPVIPLGITIPLNVVEQFRSWYDEICQHDLPDNYLTEVESFMNIIFGIDRLHYNNDDNVDNLSFANMSILDSPMLITESGENSRSKQQVVRVGESPLITPGSTSKCSIKSYQDSYKQLIHELTKSIAIQPLVFDNFASISDDVTDLTCIVAPSDSSAPILAMVYANGDVDQLIITGSVQQIPICIFPLWENSTQGISLNPHLVAIERVKYHGKISNASKSWRIIADPIYGHVFHIFSTDNSNAFAIKSNWIESAILQSKKVNISEDVESEDVNTTDAVSISNRLSDQITFDVEFGGPLCGYLVVCDAVLGHQVFCQDSLGVFKMLSFSSYLKLFELEDLSKKMYSKFSISNKSELLNDKFQREQMLSYEKSLSHLRNIAVNIPKPTEDFYLKGDQHETESIADLQKASQYVTDKIMLQFEEFSQKILYRMETIETMLQVQLDVIDGKDSSQDNLSGQLQKLAKSHEELVKRLGSIQNVFESQKRQVEELYERSTSNESSLSNAEKSYKEELSIWSKELHSISSMIEKIRRKQTMNNLLQTQEKRHQESLQSRSHSEYWSPSPLSGRKSIISPIQGSGNKSSSKENLVSFASPSEEQQRKAVTPSTPLSISNLPRHYKSPYRPSGNLAKLKLNST